MLISIAGTMSKFSFITLVLLVSLETCTPPNTAASDHVVLISIDGFRPDLYLDAAWPAPTLQRMAREGAHVEMVRGVFPSETYPGHTTLVTGALPESHGIYYNVPFEEGGPTGNYHWYASEIRVSTLWDAVRARGLRSASLLWPVSVGASIDWNIPEIWSPDEKVMRLFEKHLSQVKGWIHQQPNCDVIFVDYERALREPLRQAEQVQVFLGQPLDVERMADVVDLQLHRNQVGWKTMHFSPS